MNVCVINEGGAFGGAEIHTLQLVGRLASSGHEVHVIECRKPVMQERSAPESRPAGVHFSTVALSTDTINPGDVRRWMKALRLKSPAHAIFVKNYYLRGSLPFLFALRRSCARVSFIEHLEALPVPPRTAQRYFGVIPRLQLWRHRDRVRRRLPAAFADRVIAVSAKVRERLISDCGYPADKISVARNGVRFQEFARDAASGLRFRESLGIPRERCLITILARLEYAKGIDLALQAIALCGKNTGSRPVHLLIAGTGALDAELRQQAAALGIGDQVTFAGFLADPKPALWASDCILFSSRREGLPLGLLEGMAAGCLPVVTRISGMPEVVSRPDLGWVVEPESPVAIAAALAELAALDHARLTEFRQRVVAHIEECFDLTKSQQRLLEQLGLCSTSHPVIVEFPGGGDPYTDYFCPALAAAGAVVRKGDYSNSWLLANLGDADYVHLHWPSNFYAKPTTWARCARRSSSSRYWCGCDSRGVRILWTAHNLYPHERNKPRGIDYLVRKILIALCAKIFIHGQAPRAILQKEFGIEPSRMVSIHHGHFLDHYPHEVTREQARARLDIPAEARVFGFIGNCRRYKNVTRLVAVFQQHFPDCWLVIAGKCNEDSYRAEIEAQIRRAPARIIFEPRFIADAELQNFVRATDVVVVPFKDVLTSGSTILALSFGRPVVAPGIGYLLDIIGPDTGMLYDGADDNSLAASMRAALARRFDQDTITRYASTLRWQDAAQTVVTTCRGL